MIEQHLSSSLVTYNVLWIANHINDYELVIASKS